MAQPTEATLLAIDDEPVVLGSIAGFFEDAGFNVLRAETGEDGLEVWRREKPDVVLVDLRMPGISGLGVIAAIAAESPDTPVIVVSGTGALADAIDAVRLGAWDYVTKPIQDMDVLRHVVDKALERAHLLRERRHHERHLEEQVEKRTAELRAAGEALRASEAELRALVHAMTDVILVLDAEGRYLRIPESNPSLLYKPPGELLGKTLHEVFPGDLADRFLDSIARTLDSRRPVSLEYSLPIGEREYWFGTTLSPLSENEILAVARDITDLKESEAELIKYRDHLEDLVQQRTAELETARNRARQYLDIAGVILVAIDADRRVTMINQKGCDLLQTSSEDIIGKDWFEAFVPQSVRQETVQAYRQLVTGEIGPVEYFENPVLATDGRERLIAWHNVLLRDDEGNISGTLSSGEDITEQRRADEQIMRLNQDLEERAAALGAANKELEAFAHTVSHDLMTPLRHMDGFLGLLKKKVGGELDQESQHYLDTVFDSARRMRRMIDDLLSFSRMGRRALSLKRVELAPLVRDVIRELEPDAADRSIVWSVGDLPAVRGDASLLRVALSNLISNALKFTRSRPQARIEIGSLRDKTSETVIFVRDNGVGFDMTYVDKLFGVFQRLHRAEDFEGTGIGLANVHRIVTRHGGRTWAQGEPDRGAAFYFTLPSTPRGDNDGRP